jgi:flagellar basal body L-ring protein FlgH
MVQSKKRYMWSNHPALKVNDIITISINFIRHSMGLSKHQEHGMNALETY